MECEECNVIFIGAEWHRVCAVCAGINEPPPVFIHVTPKCEHTFKGWRAFEDGRGGETVCSKCGIGAMSDSLRNGM